MKRIIALALIMCLLLTACGQGGAGDKDTNSLALSGTVTEGELKGEKETDKNNLVQLSGGYDAEAQTLRNAITEAEDAPVDVKGTVYYISPDGDDFNAGTSPEEAWGSLDALVLNSWMFEEGDAILLERGGVYRQNSSIIANISGIYYGAYGEGPKPAIYGSAKDYADPLLWEPSNKKNIWKMAFPNKSAGIVVFNNGTWAGEREMGLASLVKNGDFYHNVDDNMFYIYCEDGNPGEVYDNIEIGIDQHIFIVYGGRHDITIDNICFKYTGAHGITFYEDNYNINVTNCELGWIGGSVQKGVTRYGNAIQFWDSCWDINVKNNWIYQIYDAGFTFQYSDHGEGKSGGQYKNIVFTENLVEYCTYSVEIFSESLDAYIKDITISDNVMRFCGYGWGQQRPSKTDDGHINFFSSDPFDDIITNLNIKNNVFDCTTTQVITCACDYSGIKVAGNSFYEKAYGDNLKMNFGPAGKKYAKNQAELEAAIKTFDKSPKLVKWLEQ